MKKQKNTIPSGFEDMLGSIYGNAEGQEEVTKLTDDMGNPIGSFGVDPIDDEPKNEPPVNNDPEDGNVEDPNKQDPNAKDDDSPIPPSVNNPEPPVTEPPVEEPDEEPTDADVIEAQQVGLFFDALGASLGWNMDEIDEKSRPLTVDQLTEYMRDVVQENSVPQYADERIQKLDEYVKNGGKFEDFYEKQQAALTLDDINLEDENNQKAVIRELMQRNGYTNE